jgi:hypothetical protein
MKELVIREIIFDDIYEFLKIIQDVKIDLEVKTEDQNKNKFTTGIEFIKSTIANFYTAKEKTNTFLGSLVGLSGKDFGKLPLKDSGKVLRTFIEVAKDAGFFVMFASIFPQKK